MSEGDKRAEKHKLSIAKENDESFKFALQIVRTEIEPALESVMTRSRCDFPPFNFRAITYRACLIGIIVKVSPATAQFRKRSGGP